MFVSVFSKKVVTLQRKPYNFIFMTALQLNAELYRAMGVIADDETLMTKEEFLARVDKAKEGPSYEMLPGENLTDFLTRQGYEI